MSKPGSHTGLLGALRLAAEEMRAAGPGKKKVIIMLSDFIQDDQSIQLHEDTSD